MNNHETKHITITSADVDVLMVPIIQWMNSIDGITTKYCCQGEPFTLDLETCDIPPNTQPYIIFVAETLDALGKVLLYTVNHAGCTVEWHRYSGSLRYNLRFLTQNDVKRFTEKNLKTACNLNTTYPTQDMDAPI